MIDDNERLRAAAIAFRMGHDMGLSDRHGFHLKRRGSRRAVAALVEVSCGTIAYAVATWAQRAAH